MLSFSLMNAQIGINTNNPDSSATLDLYAADKGMSIPNIALQNRTDVATIPNPKESLIIYNTNPNVIGGKAFYFWNGTRWDFVFSDLNASLLQNVAKYYAAVNNTPFTFTSPSQFYGNANHNIGDLISQNGTWTTIPELTTNIVVDREVNEAIFTIAGMIEANNTISGGNILTSLGIFIDDQLVDVKPFDLKMADNCSFRTFKLYGYTRNITTGNHTVKFAVRNRTTEQAGISITFGGKNPSTNCNNTISNDEARMTSIILINQPFNF